MALSIGGCFDLENPGLDARIAEPQWMHSSNSVVQLTKCDETSDPIRFSLWRLPGRKTLFFDGRQILVNAQIDHEIIRIALSGSVHDGCVLACTIPVTGSMRTTCSRACRIFDLLTMPGAARPGAVRPNRSALVHMRTLQAIDGDSAGATHREIAEALFGHADTWQRWSQDSELRAQVRYLLSRGRTLINGGYRLLLTSGRTLRQGEFKNHSESP